MYISPSKQIIVNFSLFVNNFINEIYLKIDYIYLPLLDIIKDSLRHSLRIGFFEAFLV